MLRTPKHGYNFNTYLNLPTMLQQQQLYHAALQAEIGQYPFNSSNEDYLAAVINWQQQQAVQQWQLGQQLEQSFRLELQKMRVQEQSPCLQRNLSSGTGVFIPRKGLQAMIQQELIYSTCESVLQEDDDEWSMFEGSCNYGSPNYGSQSSRSLMSKLQSVPSFSE
eukprot:TRINITY_DN108586_c0_g1_i1.p1 TRINITY_DN108586_c0_g1~~TRINITY_DN108586_c0_g1_i1.p1  ORF type:complete len:165 (+),score=11.62 TRINITY_DN108586_c0_g1_i1:135-629(+)